jgi:hypothetical protein
VEGARELMRRVNSTQLVPKLRLGTQNAVALRRMSHNVATQSVAVSRYDAERRNEWNSEH